VIVLPGSLKTAYMNVKHAEQGNIRSVQMFNFVPIVKLDIIFQELVKPLACHACQGNMDEQILLVVIFVRLVVRRQNLVEQHLAQCVKQEEQHYLQDLQSVKIVWLVRF
jgi:hypothetical protein